MFKQLHINSNFSHNVNKSHGDVYLARQGSQVILLKSYQTSIKATAYEVRLSFGRR